MTTVWIIENSKRFAVLEGLAWLVNIMEGNVDGNRKIAKKME